MWAVYCGLLCDNDITINDKPAPSSIPPRPQSTEPTVHLESTWTPLTSAHAHVSSTAARSSSTAPLSQPRAIYAPWQSSACIGEGARKKATGALVVLAALAALSPPSSTSASLPLSHAPASLTSKPKSKLRVNRVPSVLR